MNAWQVVMALLMMIGGFCIYYWVPMGDPEKCRIIRKNGEETGEVRNSGGFVLPFNGWLADYIETEKRFMVDVPEFLVGFPNEESAATSLTLIFEMEKTGGRAFVKNGKQSGVVAKATNIGRAAILNFGQSKKEGPMAVDEAQIAPEEFVLRVADAFADENLVAQAASIHPEDERKEFVKKIANRLAEAEGEYVVSKFGVRLVGVIMTNFVEPPVVAEAKAAKKAATIKNAQEKEAMQAVRENINTLTGGRKDVPFRDEMLGYSIVTNKPGATFSASERIVRLESTGPSGEPIGAVDKLIAGIIATFQEQNKGGGKK